VCGEGGGMGKRKGTKRERRERESLETVKEIDRDV